MSLKDNNMGFLLSDVSRLMRKKFQQRLDGSALTFVQARVLVHLSRNEGIRQIELADLLEEQPMSLVRIIDQLESAGIIVRRADPADRRAYQLFLTHLAKPHLRAIETVGKSIRASAFRDLTDEQAETVFLALSKMRNNLMAE